MPLSPEQQLAELLRGDLTEWNTASLFPEGLGGKDVFRLRDAGEYFLQAREAELKALHGTMQNATQTQDATTVLRSLDEALVIEHEVQRARIYYKLLSVQNPQVQGFADLYEAISNRCNGLDALAESLPQPLSQMSIEVRQTMLDAAPSLREHMHALFPEKYGRYPGLNPAQAGALNKEISNEKTGYLHEYHLAHAKGIIPGSDTTRLNQTANAFNAMLRTTTKEAHAFGYQSPLDHFASWQRLPTSMLSSWFTTATETAEAAAKKMHTLFTGNHFTAALTRQHYPDGQTVHYSWPQARSIVTEALCKFNPTYRPILDDAFEKGWIQSKPLGNNPYGGETYNNLPKVFSENSHPMVLSEFRGTAFDVIRLAHELGGHCLSIEVANRQHTPLHVADSTLQETFALFAQRLVADEMLARTSDKVQRATILRTVADDWYQNLYETTARCRFQQAAYTAAQQPDGSLRDLSAQELTNLFSAINAPIRYGVARTDPSEPARWSNIHHFVTQMPYYNASYSFATMASASLYNQWKLAAPVHKTAIANQWTDIMAQGGMVRFPEAMAQLGTNVYTTRFFENGIDSVDTAIKDAQSAISDISTTKLFFSLSPSKMYKALKEHTQHLFGHDPKPAALKIPAGMQAARPSQSSPAQPDYGLEQPGSTPSASSPNQASSSQGETQWTARYPQQSAELPAPAPQQPINDSTKWRDQAMGSHRNNEKPSVPTWAI